MEWWAVFFWILLLAVPWTLWMRRTLQEWPKLRREARQAQATTWESAVRRHADTGVRLLKEKKWPEAIDAFDDALDILQPRQPRQALPTPQTPPKARGAVARTRGAVAETQGGVPEREAEYRDDPSQEVSLLFYRGYALEQMGELEEAIADYEDCQAIYGGLYQDMQYVAAVRQGDVLAKLGRSQEAEQHLQRTITALQRGPQSVSWLQIEAFHILVGMSREMHNHARAVEYAQQGARAAHRMRDATARAGFLRMAGYNLDTVGESEGALRCYEQSLDVYRRLGETGGGARVTQDIATLYQLQGQWDKALSWLQACLADEERDQNKHRQAQLCYDIACVYIDQGNLRDAGRLLQQSISLFRQIEDHQGIDQVGRTMMGLSILVHRRITAHQMTFRDVERGVKSNKEGK
jgi:tetratricopeptide (TPR) repeat protein